MRRCVGTKLPRLIIVAVVSGLLALVVSSAAAKRSCRTFRASGATLVVTIQHGRVTCATARHVLRDFFHGRGKMQGPPNGPAYKQWWSVDGWACGFGAGGGGCSRSGSLIQAFVVGRIQAAARRSCGGVSGSSGGATTDIQAIQTSCSAARHVARDWIAAHCYTDGHLCRVAGWGCRSYGIASGAVRTRCVKGRRRIAFYSD